MTLSNSFASRLIASTTQGLLNLLDALGWKYAARLKINRLLDAQAVRERWPHRYGHARGRLRKVSHEVLVVKDGRRYFVTNDVELTAREVKRRYRHRQQIEEVFRLLKQEFGGAGRARRRRGRRWRTYISDSTRSA